MQSLLRNWNCRGCGRDNKTEVAPDGTVTCEYCADVKIIQPARNRGGETSLQISRFTRKNATHRASPGGRDLDSPSADGDDLHDALERREAFARLRETHLEAQELVTSDGLHTNLEWILGERRDATQKSACSAGEDRRARRLVAARPRLRAGPPASRTRPGGEHPAGRDHEIPAGFS